MLARNVPFINMAFRNAVIREQDPVIFLLKKWFDAFAQSIYVFLVVIVRFDSCELKPVFTFFVLLFCIFYCCFITTHGIMWIHGYSNHFFELRIFLKQLVKSLFHRWTSIS